MLARNIYGICRLFFSGLICFYSTIGASVEKERLFPRQVGLSCEVSQLITQADNEIQLRRIKKLVGTEKINVDQFFAEVRNLRRKNESGN